MPSNPEYAHTRNQRTDKRLTTPGEERNSSSTRESITYVHARSIFLTMRPYCKARMIDLKPPRIENSEERNHNHKIPIPFPVPGLFHHIPGVRLSFITLPRRMRQSLTLSW